MLDYHIVECDWARVHVCVSVSHMDTFDMRGKGNSNCGRLGALMTVGRKVIEKERHEFGFGDF